MNGATLGAAYMVLVVWLQFVTWSTQSGTLQTTLDHLIQHDAPLTYVLWQGGVTQPTCGAAITIVRKARQPRVGTAIAARTKRVLWASSIESWSSISDPAVVSSRQWRVT